MVYKVRFIETTIKTVEVKAESMDEAYNLAEELYASGELEIDRNFDSCEAEWTVEEVED